jgi:hypothetical protein
MTDDREPTPGEHMFTLILVVIFLYAWAVL